MQTGSTKAVLHRRLQSITAAAFFLAAAFAPASADMIDTSGMEPWEVCALCHSLDGNSRMAKFPKLAGQRPAYIEKQVRDFHDGNRSNDGGQMQAISTEVAQTDLSDIATYFSGLTAPAAILSGGSSEAAARLFNDGRDDLPACLSCHGQSDPALPLAPWLEAQHADYIAKQLYDFRDGKRTNDPDGLMQSIARQLTDEDIQDLAVFIAAQERPERTP